MAIFCTNCGKQLNESSKFCVSCGQPIVQQIVQQPAVVPQTQNTQQYAQPQPQPPPQQSPPQQPPQQPQQPQQQYTANPQNQYRQPHYQTPPLTVPKKKSKSKTVLIVVGAGVIVVALVVVMIVTSVFGLLGKKDESGGNSNADVGRQETPPAEMQPGDDTENEQDEASPELSEPGRFGMLTGRIMEIFESGTFHLLMIALNNEFAGDGTEMYSKDGVLAFISEFEGEPTRFITRDGTTYMVRDTARIVIQYDAQGGDDEWPYNTSDLTYVRNGTEAFNGGTYEFDEYVDSAGGQYFYYVDGGRLIGMRIIDMVYNDTTDAEVLVFDQNVPDDIFDIPQDYLLIG